MNKPGGPEALQLTELPTPEPRVGWVSIRVRAFGLNRSEWFTRRGDSPGVKLPRVLGIECVGEVVANPGGDLKQGQRVAAMMSRLNERERSIIGLRYGLTDGYPHTLREIGEIFGISRERVRQIEAIAFRKIS